MKTGTRPTQKFVLKIMTNAWQLYLIILVFISYNTHNVPYNLIEQSQNLEFKYTLIKQSKLQQVHFMQKFYT